MCFISILLLWQFIWLFELQRLDKQLDWREYFKILKWYSPDYCEETDLRAVKLWNWQYIPVQTCVLLFQVLLEPIILTMLRIMQFHSWNRSILSIWCWIIAISALWFRHIWRYWSFLCLLSMCWSICAAEELKHWILMTLISLLPE